MNQFVFEITEQLHHNDAFINHAEEGNAVPGGAATTGAAIKSLLPFQPGSPVLVSR